MAKSNVLKMIFFNHGLALKSLHWNSGLGWYILNSREVLVGQKMFAASPSECQGHWPSQVKSGEEKDERLSWQQDRQPNSSTGPLSSVKARLELKWASGCWTRARAFSRVFKLFLQVYETSSLSSIFLKPYSLICLTNTGFKPPGALKKELGLVYTF